MRDAMIAVISAISGAGVSSLIPAVVAETKARYARYRRRRWIKKHGRPRVIWVEANGELHK